MYKNLTLLFAALLVSMGLSAQNAADSCTQAINISAYFTNSPTPVFSPLYNNIDATGETGLAGVDCFSETDFGDTIVVDNSIWFQFLGDGQTYQIQTAPCNADTNYIDGGDTQMAVYDGDCGNLTPVACNEDLSYSTFGDFRAGVVVETTAGSPYFLMIDGFGGAEGAFCLQVVQSQAGLNDDCALATDISSYFGQPTGVASLTPVFDNTNATTSATDPTVGFDCFNEPDGPTLENTTFYNFVGDGNYYQITTAPCAGAINYNEDTQMAIYEGSNCQFGQAVDCNDDFYGNTGIDLRAGVNLLTVPGQQYVMMIDGWNGNTGDFCIEITQLTPIGCSDATFGAADDSDINLCFGGSAIGSLDSAATVVPNIGAVSGFTWLISSQPFPAGYIGSPIDFADYITNTGLLNTYYDFPIENDTADPITPGTYFITPFMIGGDSPNDCYLYSSPIALHVFEALTPLVTTSVVTPEIDLAGNGSIVLSTSGGSGNYTYNWSNGSTNQNQNNLSSNNYLVTIADQSGCAASLVLTIIVPDSTTATNVPNDECATAANISAYFGQPVGVASLTPIYDNTGATPSASDPTSGYDCFNENPGTLDNTTFYEFTGDGNFYQIVTVPCAGVTNYNEDTQMAIYEGSACNYGQSVACNDDFYAGGDPDYRAGTTLVTAPGQQYIIMIDGWGGNPGDYCIEITQLQAVGCAQAQLGIAETDELSLCFDGSATYILDGTTTIVPNIGPIAGFTWLITSDPVPSGYNLSPDNLPGFFGYSGLSGVYYDLPIVNDPSNPIPQGTYYITPYLVSGATQVGNDPIGTTGGCNIYGPSLTLNAYEELDPLQATTTITPATQPNSNGSIVLNILGGSAVYAYEWSNGSTTQNISGLSAGNYIVTVSDFSGCATPLILTINVPSIVATQNLSNVVLLQTMPNPTNGPLNFSIQLIDNQPVMVKLVNSLGQIIDRRVFAEGENFDGSFDLSAQSSGVYFLRFEIGSQTTERRIVLVK